MATVNHSAKSATPAKRSTAAKNPKRSFGPANGNFKAAIGPGPRRDLFLRMTVMDYYHAQKAAHLAGMSMAEFCRGAIKMRAEIHLKDFAQSLIDSGNSN